MKFQLNLPFRAKASKVLALLLLATTAGAAWGQASPSPFTYATRYDAMGRVTGTIAPDPDNNGPLHYLAVRNTYDAGGRLVRVESGELGAWYSEDTLPMYWSNFTVFNRVEMAYDGLDRKILEQTAGSTDGSNTIQVAESRFSYDPAGRLQCSAVRMNPGEYGTKPDACVAGSDDDGYGPDRVTKNEYDAANRLYKVHKAVGITDLEETYATYGYSDNGMRTSMTDARGFRTEMWFDGLDRQSDLYFPSKTTPGAISGTDFEHYEYDPNGNRHSLRKRDGYTLIYDYDALNRMSHKSVPEHANLDSSHTRDVTYGYDSMGHMTSATFDSGGGLSMDFDGFGDQISSGVSLEALSASLTMTYDADDNRQSTSFGGSSYVTYAYDGLDRATSIVRGDNATLANFSYLPNGKRGTMGGGYATTYGYDPAGRLNTLVNAPASSGYTVSFNYAYNPASQMTQLSRNNDAYAYTQAVNTNKNYSPNGLNEYTNVGGVDLAYDDNGNLTYDGSRTYQYDVENRLVSVSGASNALLRYDPLGRLYQSYGDAAGTNYFEYFVYDGDALVQENGSSNNVLRRYIHGVEAGDDPIVWFESSGFGDAQEHLLRADHQGSIISVGDATTANIQAVNSYDEYGNPGSSNAGRFQYTGQAWVPEAGLYYYKARMYSPKLGRFMQTDPIGYADDTNLYAYVGADPVNKLDPSGRCTGSYLCDKDGNCTTAFCVGPGQAQRIQEGSEKKGIHDGPIANSSLAEPFQMGLARWFEQKGICSGDTCQLMSAAVFIFATRGSVRGVGAPSTGAAVIGKLSDLKSIAAGERTLLDRLPDLGSPKANWAQNSSVLRQEMSLGRSIRDATVDVSGQLINNTGFLRAERNLLETHGWTYDSATTLWSPSAP